MQDEFQEYFKLLLDPGNPIYFSLLTTIILIFLILFTYKYIIAPIRKKHLLEKKELELKNIKLMALFAELDPNPLIRLDEKGMIIHTNDAALSLWNNNSLIGKALKEILPSINFPMEEFIKNDKSKVFYEKVNEKFFSIMIRGISYLNIAQIYFDDLTERKAFEEELELSKSKLRELSGHLRDTLEDERQRIARELHDSIGQNLNLIRMKMQHNEFSKDSLSKEKNALIDALEISINELKEITYNLKPKILDEWGLGASLNVLVKKISEEVGICGTVNINGNEERLNKKLELTLYRLCQEALSNIIKHSRAKEFNIQLIFQKESLKFLISDDGVGFDPHNSKSGKYSSGFGLINMQERVETFKGKLKIDSSPGNGTVIIVEIPRDGK